MARVTLKFKDRVLKSYQFKTSINIGRIAGNDIVMENPAVSGKHAAIEVIDNHYILKDLGSKNGVFVNDKKVQEHELQEGDNVLIGKHILEFDFSPGGTLVGVQNQEEHELSGMTMCLDTRQYKDLLEVKAPPQAPKTEPLKQKAQKKAEPSKRAKIIMQSVSTGRPTEIFLEKSKSIIGKKTDADVHIHGFLCAEISAIIEKRKDRFVIRHCGGFSKTKVNGVTAKEVKALSDGDQIKIGPNELTFREIL